MSAPAPRAGGFAGRVGRAGAALVVQNALNLAALVFVSRGLGAEDYGRFGVAIFFSIQACQLLQWGMHPLAVRDLVREPERAREILGACLRQRTITALALAAAGVVAAIAWRGEPGPLIVALGVADGVLLGFTMQAAFDAKLRPATHVLVCHLRPAGFLAGCVALRALAPESFGAPAVLAIHAAAIALSIGVEWAVIRRLHGAPIVAGTGPRAAALWREAVPLALGDLATTLLATATVPIVARLGHAAETGHLNLSGQIAVSMGSLAAPPAAMLHADLSSRPDPFAPSFRREVLRLTVLLVLAGAAACALASLLAPALVPLAFGDAYAPSGRLLQVDAWRVAGLLGGAALVSGLLCRRRAGLVAACQAAGLLVTLAIALAAVPSRGAMAAAAASALGRGAALVALLVAFVAISGRGAGRGAATAPPRPAG